MRPFRHTNSVTRYRRGPVLLVVAIAVAGTLDYYAEQERRDDWRKPHAAFPRGLK